MPRNRQISAARLLAIVLTLATLGSCADSRGVGLPQDAKPRAEIPAEPAGFGVVQPLPDPTTPGQSGRVYRARLMKACASYLDQIALMKAYTILIRQKFGAS